MYWNSSKFYPSNRRFFCFDSHEISQTLKNLVRRTHSTSWFSNTLYRSHTYNLIHNCVDRADFSHSPVCFIQSNTYSGIRNVQPSFKVQCNSLTYGYITDEHIWVLNQRELLGVDKHWSLAETSSGTIASHSNPIDGFAPGQPCPSASPGLAITGPWHFFFLIVAGSALVRDEIIKLGTVQLAHLALLPDLFKLTNVAKYNLQPIGITQGLTFLKNSSNYPSETCRQNMQNACMHAANFYLKKN